MSKKKQFLMLNPQQMLQMRHMVLAMTAKLPWWVLVPALLVCYGVVFFVDLIPVPIPEAVITSQPQQYVFAAMALKAWIEYFADDDEKE